MTVFEIFPWLLAICITLLSAALFMQRFDMHCSVAWILALLSGSVSLALYWLGLRMLGGYLDRAEDAIWGWQKAKRKYHELVQSDHYPVGENLYYECTICGNAIPSVPKKDVRCPCGNVVVSARQHNVKIRDPRKVRLFSIIE